MFAILQWADWQASLGVAFVGFLAVLMVSLWIGLSVGVVRWLLGAPSSGRVPRGVSSGAGSVEDDEV
jgi:hypothetical protein